MLRCDICQLSEIHEILMQNTLMSETVYKVNNQQKKLNSSIARAYFNEKLYSLKTFLRFAFGLIVRDSLNELGILIEHL